MGQYEQVQDMITQFTLDGFNSFNVTGSLVVSAISISLTIPINEEITLYPTLIGNKEMIHGYINSMKEADKITNLNSIAMPVFSEKVWKKLQEK